MDNLPVMVLLGVGALLVLVIVLYFISQKKQDKKEALESQKMLETLDIDLKDASEDIDDTVASEESDTDAAGASREPSDTAAGEPEPKTAAKRDDKAPVTEPDTAPDAEPDTEPDTEPETDAVTEPAGETSDADKMEQLAIESDEAMMARDEVVLELDEEPSQKTAAAEDDFDDFDDVKKPPADASAEPGDAAAVFDDSEPDAPAEPDDMSELDALFEASSDVEELVLSGKNLTEDDIVKDASAEDFFHDDTFAPDTEPATETDAADTAVAEPDELELDDGKPSDLKSAAEADAEAEIAQEKAKPEPKPAAPAAMDPEEQKRHEKARRIARVIVNDIRNYNPENLAEGIRMGNIMKTLGKEVERGRLLYIKRVPQDITRETNYYREALIKILADGRPDLLGL